MRGTLAPGDRLDEKYEIVEEIGQGGMAIVYEARHVGLGSRVAIKILRPDLAIYPALVTRFTREARAAVRLESEHVARVIDVGAASGSRPPFIVMERLRGRDLRAEIDARGPLPIEVAVGWMLEACEAVAEAHARGIVHRDLKPSNLFLARRDDGRARIKVLDFGIAKAADESLPDPSLTGALDVFGSPRYMSPEQLRATGNVDGRSDIWALGVVLFELLSGRTPFPGRSAPEVHAAILAEPVPPIAREGLPDALRAVVSRCLEKDQTRRFANVAELAKALAAFAPADTGRSLGAIEAWSAAPSEPGHVTAPISGPMREDTLHTDAPASDRRVSVDRGAQTTTAWDRTPERRPSRGIWLGVLFLLLSSAVVATLLATRSAPTSASSPASAASPPSPPPVATATTEPAPSATEAASAPAPPPVASASAPTKAAPARTSRPPATPGRPPRSTYDDRE